MQFFGPNLPKKGSHFPSKTDKIDTTIELVFVSNFTLDKQFRIFGPTLPKKVRYLWSKTEKVSNIIEFRIFELVLVPKFHLKWQFGFFWPDLPKKGFSGLEQKKWQLHIFYIILDIQISLVQISAQTDDFNFLDQICPKRYFQSKTEKWTSPLNSAYLN